MALVFTLCLLEKTAVIFSQWCLILLTSCCWWVGICWYLKVFLLIFSNYANTNILFLSFILDFGNSEALCHPVQHIIDILWCIFSYSFSHLLLSYKICILPLILKYIDCIWNNHYSLGLLYNRNISHKAHPKISPQYFSSSSVH